MITRFEVRTGKQGEIRPEVGTTGEIQVRRKDLRSGKRTLGLNGWRTVGGEGLPRP